jgi:glycosyltransferase involved in cell wall biosynthesis
VLPWHYFRLLRQQGVDVRLLTHARTRDELLALLPAEAGRMYFLKDTLLNKLCWKLGRLLPAQISHFTFGYVSRLATQAAARRMARRLVAEHGIDVVHQPIPVSPREPSLLHGLGAPVVIGPMNGNMTYPPAFIRKGKWKLLEEVIGLGRWSSNLLNRLMPGKLRAAALLVANPRTGAALPRGIRGEVIQLVENGVDLAAWYPRSEAARAPDQPTRFVFIGRLVDWKAVDLLLAAFARLPGAVQLDIIGDGPMMSAWSALARQLGTADRVRFHGWLAQADAARRLRDSDVLVLPSIYECGGAVVLEAMATGLPVIATAWGGPADYLDASCGILVAPSSREELVDGLAQAMDRLHRDPDLRTAMGRSGRRKAEAEYDWSAKVERVLAIHRGVAARYRAAGAGM